MEPGAALSHYRILEKIGEGGMGVVYRAEDTRLKRDVAVKVLRAGTLTDPAARKRFRKEALALSRLNHPNIAMVFDFDTEDDVDFLVMEYIGGKSLDEMLEDGPLPEREIGRLGKQLAEGLAAAHGQGLVHRDLKPANLRITPDGRLKILDFGVAKAVRASSDTATTHTQTRGFVGTLPYMAPEQLQGEPVDARTDIYAGGVVLYEMATGRRPFAGVRGDELLAAILRTVPRPPSEVQRRLDPAMEAVILKALDKDPSRRYQSVRELEVDLERATAPVPLVSASRPWVVTIRGRLQARILGGVVVVLLLGVAAVLAFLFSGIGSHPALSFAPRDWILIADFENETGDPLFDKSLLTAFTVSLEQSAHANVVPRSRIKEVLNRMGRPDNQRIDIDTGREICVREGVRGLVTGAIGRVGSEYALSARLVDPGSGEAVRSYMERARGDTQILNALGAIARDLRRDLGESLAAIEQSDRPLPRVTTPSLAALRLFADAQHCWDAGDYDEGARLWETALEHDRDFAMAHANLGSAYYSHIYSKVNLAEEHYRRAIELTERTTDRERLFIQASYAADRGHHAEAIERYRAYLDSYPDGYGVRYNLGNTLRFMGRFEQAAREYREVVRLDPEHASAFINLATTYREMGRIPEALENYERAFELHPEWVVSSNLNHEYGMTLVINGERERGRGVFEQAAANPDMASKGLRSLAYLDLYEGRFSRARDRLEDAVLLHEAGQELLSATRVHIILALVLDTQGDRRAARTHLERAAALVDPQESLTWIMARLGIAYVRLGNPGEAARILEQVRARTDRGSRRQRSLLHQLEGEIELATGDAERAIELLQLADSEHRDATTMESLAHAYSTAGRTGEAIAAYEEVIAKQHLALGWEPQLSWLDAHRRLAEAYRERGDTEQALATIRALLELWREADPDIRLLTQARRLEAALRTRTTSE
jgi:tetratricopeptide (TPR) repeat protein/tRNA A-37 threonylcarbamoyl transferase component Bud32